MICNILEQNMAGLMKEFSKVASSSSSFPCFHPTLFLLVSLQN